jgi:hypothetical protein
VSRLGRDCKSGSTPLDCWYSSICFRLPFEARDLMLRGFDHHPGRSKNNLQPVEYLPSFFRSRFTSFFLALGASFNSFKRKTRLDKR